MSSDARYIVHLSLSELIKLYEIIKTADELPSTPKALKKIAEWLSIKIADEN